MSELTEIDRLKEKVEERLIEQQKSKEFKDVGRVAQTKKEKSAYRLISSSVLSDLEQDPIMAYNMVKKDNVWQPIDVNLEKEMGVSSGAAFLKVKIREALPARPKDKAKEREAYVHFIESLVSELSKCYSVNDIEKLREYYQKMSADEIISTFIEPNLFKENEELREQAKLRVKSDPRYRKMFLYSYGLAAKVAKEVFGAKFANLLFRGSDAANSIWSEAKGFEAISKNESELLIEELVKRKNNFVAANKEKIEQHKYMTSQELRIAMDRDWKLHPDSKKLYKQDIEKFRTWVLEYYERRIKNEISRYDDKLKAVEPKDNDWSWFEQPKGKSESVKEKAASINTKEPLAYIKRTGGYKIPEITSKFIVDAFGFSAVNYGVYVDDVWSKEHTKHFLGAMCDLAEMINVDIKQMNQLGKLGIAFGAKGRKGHLATYFSQTKDINLTKGNGDGSVAHEWGHYLDNVIVDLDKKKSTTLFATQGHSPNYDLALLFKEFSDFCKKGNDQVTPKVPMTFLAKKFDTAPSYFRYVNNNWKSEPIVILDTIEETLAQYSDLMKVDYQDKIYSTQRKVFGYIINAFDLDSYEIPLKISTSYFYHKSAYNYFKYCGTNENGRDAIVVKGRTQYWTSEVELFARAWETVILKKLMDKNRESNYLVADIPMEDVIAETYFVPYPQGKELDYIENIIDRIIVRVKMVFGIGSFVPVSDIREDQYLDLSTDKTKGKVDSGMVIEKITPQEEEIVFIEKDKTVEVVEKEIEAPQTEQKEEDIDAVIDGLEVLLETMQGAERKELEEVIEGLKLLK